MNYTEIAKLINYLFKAVFIKRVQGAEGNPEDSTELTDLIENYDLKPVFIELQRNFAEGWYSERIVEQLKLDYEHYILDLKSSVANVSFKELTALRALTNRIEMSLDKPTYFDFRLLSNENNTKNDLEEPTQIWFRVGKKLASGKIKNDSLLHSSAPEIAKNVNIPEGEKYILATLNNYDNDKNIYRSERKMSIIYDYFKFNNIPVQREFIEKLNTLKDNES